MSDPIAVSPGKKASRMQQFLGRLVVGQLGRPHGIAAEAMARYLNAFNRHINEPVIAALGIRPGETVLDVGFGGGVGIQLALARLESTGQVIGIDIAVDMVRRGTRVFAKEIAAGRVRILEASAFEIPLPDSSADKAYSVGSYYHWGDVAKGIGEIARVLRPHGRLVIPVPPSAIERHERLLPDEPTPPDIAELAELYRQAGLADVTIRSAGKDIVLVAGRKPAYVPR